MSDPRIHWRLRCPCGFEVETVGGSWQWVEEGLAGHQLSCDGRTTRALSQSEKLAREEVLRDLRKARADAARDQVEDDILRARAMLAKGGFYEPGKQVASFFGVPIRKFGYEDLLAIFSYCESRYGPTGPPR